MRLEMTIVLFLTVCGSLPAQKTSRENQVRDRGQTTTDDSRALDGGIEGRVHGLSAKPLTLHGMLVDAACLDRSRANLTQPAQPPDLPAGEAGSRGSGVQAHGIAVESETVRNERADAMAHQVPDMRTRISDPSCGITANTSGLAMLLSNGRLVNLDEGGNTLVLERIGGSAAGQAMLNGTGSALKPRADIKGTLQGDRLQVSKVLKIDSR
jgi:hypothetical protein